ncbi:MAG: ATP-binding protein [Pseudomonadota bacterium]
MVFIPMHITIKSHPKNLIDIRHLLKTALNETCLSKQEHGNIVLALDEACSNIIRHSYKNDHTKQIDVDIELKPGELSITITDKGKKFDINSIAVRDITEIKPGGLGVYIIHHVMDEVDYCRTPEGCNKTKLIKKLPD